MDEGLDRRLVEMAQVRRRLASFLPEDVGLGVDEPEGVDDDFAFDRLDGIDDNRDRSRGQLLKRLLRVDVDAREPTAKSGMRMVPANYRFRSTANAIRGEKVNRENGTTNRPVCFNISIIFVWKTGSTASTDTPVPL